MSFSDVLDNQRSQVGLFTRLHTGSLLFVRNSILEVNGLFRLVCRCIDAVL